MRSGVPGASPPWSATRNWLSSSSECCHAASGAGNVQATSESDCSHPPSEPPSTMCRSKASKIRARLVRHPTEATVWGGPVNGGPASHRRNSRCAWRSAIAGPPLESSEGLFSAQVRHIHGQSLDRALQFVMRSASCRMSDETVEDVALSAAGEGDMAGIRPAPAPGAKMVLRVAPRRSALGRSAPASQDTRHRQRRSMRLSITNSRRHRMINQERSRQL